MRKALLAVLAVSLVAPVWGDEPAAKAVAAKGPKIIVEPATFNFGSVLQNKELTKDFTIRNVGTEELVIDNVSTTCGCTVADLKSRNLKPGANTPMHVTLQTRTNVGKIVKTVMIKSNDPLKPLLEVTLQADVAGPSGQAASH
jgi:hypothetical protein